MKHQKYCSEEIDKMNSILKMNDINPTLNGFTTAKGSQLKISPESLKKAKLIFDEEMRLEKGSFCDFSSKLSFQTKY